jgi:hypothetical protein
MQLSNVSKQKHNIFPIRKRTWNQSICPFDRRIEIQELTNSRDFFCCFTLQIQSMVSLLYEDFRAPASTSDCMASSVIGSTVASARSYPGKDAACIFPPRATWCFLGSQISRGLLLFLDLAHNTLNNVDWNLAPLDLGIASHTIVSPPWICSLTEGVAVLELSVPIKFLRETNSVAGI